MALSNAERQARWRQRRKEAVKAGKRPLPTPKRIWQVFMLGVCFGALRARQGRESRT